MIFKEVSPDRFTLLPEERLTYPTLSEQLMNSFQRYGIRQPVKALGDSSNPHIIAGYRRVEGARRLNLAVPTLFLPISLTPRQRWEAMLEENLAQREVTLFEKFNFLKKISLWGAALKERWLRELHLPDEFSRTLELSLPPGILERMERGDIDVKSLMSVESLSPGEMETLSSWMGSLTRSEVRELFDLVSRYKERKVGELASLVASPSAQERLEELRKLVYPTTESLNERREKIASLLPRFRWENQRHFEDGRLWFRSSFRSFQELSQRAEELRDFSSHRKGNWDEDL